MLPFTHEELLRAVEDGLVTQRKHPTLPYYIYNYSPEVQFRNYWNDVTLHCRGLILDEQGNIVARPWKKFFNLGQIELPIQFDDPVEVMDKADGSLGILYPITVDTPEVFDIGYGVATRGSFESEQAMWATRLWYQKYHNLDPLPHITMLFEIVYPGNRIVLDYGDMEDLILLGAVDNRTGNYYSPMTAKWMWTKRGPIEETEWPGPVVETYPHKSISEALSNMGRPNKEGYVIRSHNFMVKVKEPDYLDLHRLVTNATPKTVWEQLRDGKSKEQIVSAFPDEFHEYIGGMIDPLLVAYAKRSDEILKGYSEAVRAVLDGPNGLGASATRADYAKVFKRSRDAKYYFLLLDNRSIRDVLWTELKPRENDVRAQED